MNFGAVITQWWSVSYSKRVSARTATTAWIAVALLGEKR